MATPGSGPRPHPHLAALSGGFIAVALTGSRRALTGSAKRPSWSPEGDCNKASDERSEAGEPVCARYIPKDLLLPGSGRVAIEAALPVKAGEDRGNVRPQPSGDRCARGRGFMVG